MPRDGEKGGQDSEQARRLRSQGLLALREERFDEAVRLLKQALALEPGLRAAQMELVEALIEAARFEAAEKVARKALRRDPTSASLWHRLGYIHEVRNGALAAEPYYRRALAYDAEHRPSLNSLAAIHWRMGDRKRATMLVQRAAMVDPDHPETRSNLQALFDYRPPGRSGLEFEREEEAADDEAHEAEVIELALHRRRNE